MKAGKVANVNFPRLENTRNNGGHENMSTYAANAR